MSTAGIGQRMRLQSFKIQYCHWLMASGQLFLHQLPFGENKMQ